MNLQKLEEAIAEAKEIAGHDRFLVECVVPREHIGIYGAGESPLLTPRAHHIQKYVDPEGDSWVLLLEMEPLAK